MQVELLYHTPDPERAIATAARLCYAPVGASELMETMPPERVKSVLSTIMGSGTSPPSSTPATPSPSTAFPVRSPTSWCAIASPASTSSPSAT